VAHDRDADVHAVRLGGDLLPQKRAGDGNQHNRRRLNPQRLVVMGIDPGSTRAGLVALDGHSRLVIRRCLTLSGELPIRLAALYRHTAHLLEESKAAIVAVENPLHHRNLHTTDLLSRALGIVQLAAVQRGLLTLEYRPAQWRPLLSEVHLRYDVREWSPDELVACAVALRALREPIEAG